MSYFVKEIFYTLQGEGFHAGRAAVFCRFSGCNLWSGRSEDRAGAACAFCDTDFVGTDGPGGGIFHTGRDLGGRIADAWPAKEGRRTFCVLTGGEPLLQVDSELIDALHGQGCVIAMETNGTCLPPPGIDWISVSPKAGTGLLLRSGQELKLVYPQAGIDPRDFAALDFEYFFLQPMDGPHRERNTTICVNYCLDHPLWRLSLQKHKYLDIP